MNKPSAQEWHGEYDSTLHQGAPYSSQQKITGLYYAGSEPTKTIIGLGKYDSYPLEAYMEKEAALEFIKAERPAFYVIEGMDKKQLGAFLESIQKVYNTQMMHPTHPLPVTVSIVENGTPGLPRWLSLLHRLLSRVENGTPGLVERLQKEYEGIFFRKARVIGRDTIDAGLPSEFVEKALG